jgi:DNA-binding transcriptional regulator YiaG
MNVAELLFPERSPSDTRHRVPRKGKPPTTLVGKIRALTGLTQDQFGEKIGVGREMVARWETTATTPQGKHLVRIEQVFPAERNAVVHARAQPTGSTAMSDPAVTDRPPGLEGFLERHGHRLDPAERHFLDGISFSRTNEKIRMDDAWWLDFVGRLGLSGGKKDR